MTWTLVTGGAGFIGLNIVERLLSEGADVAIFDTHPPPKRALREFGRLPGRLRVIEGDICSAVSFAAAFDQPVEAVVHAAAITSGQARETAAAERIVAVNVDGTVNVARAATTHAVKRVLLVSSAAVYGQPEPGIEELDETSTPHPYTLYAATKYASELVLRRLADLHDFSLVTVRLGWVFGPWEHESGVRDTMSAIYQASVSAVGGTPFDTPHRDNREWTYSRDIATALVILLRTPSPHWLTYNVTAGARLDLAVWAERLRANTVIRAAAPKTVISEMPADGRISLNAHRFANEFEISWRSISASFSDYIDWLRSDPWPVEKEQTEL